jgi:hypothetical protein
MVGRLKAGEDVDVDIGKPADFHAILKAVGCTEADMRHMEVVATISESGFKQYVDKSQRETERHFQRSRRALARRILRREAAEDEHRHDTPPAPEPE